MSAKLMIVVNEDRFFISHRLPVALRAANEGWKVTIVSKDTGSADTIRNAGFEFIDLPINPTGMNILEEWKTFKFLFNLYRKYKPDVAHHVGMKNILWGGTAARLAGLKGVVNAVSGLGGLFSNADQSMTAKAILWLLKWGNRRNGVKLIFQNNDDKEIMLRHHVLNPEQVEFTHGSGIDLNEFAIVEEPNGEKITVIFTARMVREKGVADLIEAAEILKPEFKNDVQFWLCGRLTPNKTGITEEYLKAHCDGNYISWLGERSDIKQLLEKSHIMAFPSYYREGLPKSLIEASAIGLPIVTCDSTGCRDVVAEGVNGFLVEPQNPKMLADRLRQLIVNKSLRQKMRKESRAKAERDFNINRVVDTHIKIYNELLDQ